ncbi:hypothetical protein FAD_0742 [Ferroplasma acidiphilum]|uniref:Glycosyl transferase family 1 domain-containing protein n=1 Tax=Ferroplasma acidiphilum TaxID=74969 RepID=A0A1V0N3K0_9ARCH|nr:glycosyltransferase family 4 protein [Ferroplasma acidiphilum]ARD84646.1 hypothetical protein FAD_0742 [Ferroplasma acidiphilum]
MKLTFVTFTDLKVGRGTETVIFNLLKYKPEGIDATIVYTDDPGNNPLILSDKNVKDLIKNSKQIKIQKKSYKSKKFGKINRIYRDLIDKPAIRTLKSISKPVLEEIRDTDIAYLLYNEYAVFFNGMNIPVIGSNHTSGLELSVYEEQNTFFYRIYLKFLHQIYFKNINGYHVFPNKSQLLPMLNLKYNMVLAPGIDCSLYYPDYAVKNTKLKFLFVASLSSGKGLDILLPLIEKIDNSRAEFHIAGGGPMADEIKNNIKVIYHGILSNSELSKLYRECDVFIYPSHSDAFPAVTLQALSSGLYVMCSDYLKGNFDDFENKYLEYLPLDIEKWYSRVNEIIKNNNIIKHDKSEEYSYVKDNYDWPVISKKFYGYMMKFYNESKGINK